MSALAVVLVQSFCCLGLGAAALHALGISADDGRAEHWALAFAAGFGILGWLVFPLGVAGHLQPMPLVALLTAGCVGTVLLPRPRRVSLAGLDAIGRVLVAAIALALLFDLAEGLAPPADADSLTYHFTLPKQFLAAGRLVFLVQPLESAVPLLVQMTYVPVLGLGGEHALTLWTMVSGWAPAALLFVFARPHLGRNWSLAVTLVFLTTPALVYGGGSGQVEARIVLFALLAAWAAARALDTGDWRYAVLAGLGAGFFAAAKYTGLLFVAVAGLMVVAQSRWLRMGVCFSVAALVAGFQWYAWNAIHTGDPVFPMLFQWLGRDDLTLWSSEHDLFFKQQYFGAENPQPQSPLWLLLYPFAATLGFGSLPDSGRVGFGPYGLLMMPFALSGLWRMRDRVRRGPVLTYAAIALAFYVLFFFLGGSQRIRHLLPILPFFLIPLTVAAERVTAGRAWRAPLLAAVAVTVVLHLVGHGVFSLNYIRYLANGADRDAFLERNISRYAAVPWLNAHLGPGDRVFISARELKYFLDVPYLFATPISQAEIELRPDRTDANRLLTELRKAGINYVLVDFNPDVFAGGYPPPFDLLIRHGCVVPAHRVETAKFQSRTLPALSSRRLASDVLRLRPEGCRD